MKAMNGLMEYYQPPLLHNTLATFRLSATAREKSFLLLPAPSCSFLLLPAPFCSHPVRVTTHAFFCASTRAFTWLLALSNQARDSMAELMIGLPCQLDGHRSTHGHQNWFMTYAEDAVPSEEAEAWAHSGPSVCDGEAG